MRVRTSPYAVYILSCSDGTLYVGSTSALSVIARASRTKPRRYQTKEMEMLFELWASVALLDLRSGVGVIYNNSRKQARQMDEVVRLLTVIAEKK